MSRYNNNKGGKTKQRVTRQPSVKMSAKEEGDSSPMPETIAEATCAGQLGISMLEGAIIQCSKSHS